MSHLILLVCRKGRVTHPEHLLEKPAVCCIKVVKNLLEDAFGTTKVNNGRWGGVCTA
jgi:hypothetical protein